MGPAPRVSNMKEPLDPRLMEIVHADTVEWYHKPNLRFLYFVLIPTCIGTEWTLGFDGSMMNNLQAVPSWLECKSTPFSKKTF